MTVGLEHYLVVSAMLFVLGVAAQSRSWAEGLTVFAFACGR